MTATTTPAQLVRIGTTRGRVDISTMTAVDSLNLLAYRLMAEPETFVADWEELHARSAVAFEAWDVPALRAISAEAKEPWAAILDAHRTAAAAQKRLDVSDEVMAEVLRLVGLRYGRKDLAQIVALRALGC